MRLRVSLLLLLLLVTPAALEGARGRGKRTKKKKRSQHNTGESSSSPSQALTRGVSLALPNVGASAKLPLQVHLPPSSGKGSTGMVVRSAAELMPHVAHAWSSVVEPNQAGLVDARETHLAKLPLSEAEAWHHYQAALQGVVDSARLLIAVSVVPALQLATGQLHAAAARGDVAALKAVLDDVNSSGAALDIDATAPACGSTALHFAASVGSVGAVRLLLAGGAAVDATASHGATALMVASAMGHAGAADELIAGGADVHFVHAFGHSTALHFAAEMGRASLVTRLCAAGADAEAVKTNGGRPIHTAADADQPAAIAALLAPPCGAQTTSLMNGDTTALYLAAQRGLMNATAALLDGGADANFAMPHGRASTQLAVPGAAAPLAAGGFYPERNAERGNGATALHAAVENGHHGVVRLLLNRGAAQLPSMEGVAPLLLALQYRHPEIAIVLADAKPTPHIDARAPQDGSSALFVAAGEGMHLDALRALLAHGATVDITNAHGATPLSHAAMRGNVGAMAALLAAGADPARGPDGSGGALHALLRGAKALRGRALADAVRRLLRAGSDAETVDQAGTTPLMIAAARGERAACAALLDAGADASRASAGTPTGGVTPTMRAAAGGHAAVLRLLLSEGRADPNTRGGARLSGAGALYLAAQGKHTDAAAVLLDAGAAVDAAVDGVGATPLFVAAERGCVAMVRLLLRHGADWRAVNWNGVNAFHMAAIRGHVEVMEALHSHAAAAAGAAFHETSKGPEGMERGINDSEAMLESRGNDGSTPLLSVAAGGDGEPQLTRSRRTKTLQWLISKGANVAAARADGHTALLIAATLGHVDVIDTLLLSPPLSRPSKPAAAAAAAAAASGDAQLEGQLDARLEDGSSALTLAVKGGHLDTVRALLRGGATREPEALELAIEQREHELIALLTPD